MDTKFIHCILNRLSKTNRDNIMCQCKLEELKQENKELKSALLYYLDVTLCECSSNWNYDIDKWCNILLDCSYPEAKEKYDDFKYKDMWESE